MVHSYIDTFNKIRTLSKNSEGTLRLNRGRISLSHLYDSIIHGIFLETREGSRNTEGRSFRTDFLIYWEERWTVSSHLRGSQVHPHPPLHPFVPQDRRGTPHSHLNEKEWLEGRTEWVGSLWVTQKMDKLDWEDIPVRSCRDPTPGPKIRTESICKVRPLQRLYSDYWYGPNGTGTILPLLLQTSLFCKTNQDRPDPHFEVVD